MQVSAALEIIDWKDGSTETHLEGAFRHARISERFHGEMQGIGSIAYLMVQAGGRTHFSGFEVFTGFIGVAHGSFVMRQSGSFTPDGLTSLCQIVEGSGSGAFEHITGHGNLSMERGSPTIHLTYELADTARA